MRYLQNLFHMGRRGRLPYVGAASRRTTMKVLQAPLMYRNGHAAAAKHLRTVSGTTTANLSAKCHVVRASTPWQRKKTIPQLAQDEDPSASRPCVSNHGFHGLHGLCLTPLPTPPSPPRAPPLHCPIFRRSRSRSS